jgi:hypothetical protein
VIQREIVEARRKSGDDERDEMWDGILHWVEPGDRAYRALQDRLVSALHSLTANRRLRISCGRLFDPEVADSSNYRVPALIVHDLAATSRRGVEGKARLVVEILQPESEALDKIAFYSRVGVAELLIVDPCTAGIRHWLSVAGDLTEVPLDADGRCRLTALPVALRGEDGRILLETA